MTDKVFDIEKTISRTPSVLFEWIQYMNESSEEFSNLMDDDDKIEEVKAWCVLVCSRTISIKEFFDCVTSLEIFDLDDVGPFFVNLPPTIITHHDPWPALNQKIQKLRNNPNWLKEAYF